MHQLIVPVPPGMVIDHLDGKGYNNQEYNLRAVTLSQNRHNGKAPITNTSGCRGIEETATGKFRGRIVVEGERHSTQCFDTFEEAVEALTELRKTVLRGFATLDILERNGEDLKRGLRSVLNEFSDKSPKIDLTEFT
jgi:hypothetical protein